MRDLPAGREMQVPKVLFKVAGDEKAGMGHVFRSIELAKTIQKELSPRVYFCCNPNKKVMEVLKNEKFEFFVLKKESQVEQLIRIIEGKEIDILIVDLPELDIDLKKLKEKKRDLMIVALDYFDYSNKNVDVIINLFNQNLKVREPRSVFREYYEGPRYAIIRSSFSPYRKRKRIRAEVKEILITFGSADPNNNTVKILDLLDKMNLKTKITVVVGPAFQNKKEIIRRCLVRKYEVHLSPQDLEKLIYRADLGFCGGGTTLLEFCALGTPAIVLPQNQREERFAKYFEKRGAVIVLKKSSSERNKISKIKKAMDCPSLRKKMSAKQRKLVDLKGRERICRIILKNYRARFHIISYLR